MIPSRAKIHNTIFVVHFLLFPIWIPRLETQRNATGWICQCLIGFAKRLMPLKRAFFILASTGQKSFTPTLWILLAWSNKTYKEINSDSTWSKCIMYLWCVVWKKSLAYLKILQWIQTWWNSFQFVIVQANFSYVGNAGKASIFHILYLVELQTQSGERPSVKGFGTTFLYCTVPPVNTIQTCSEMYASLVVFTFATFCIWESPPPPL